MSDAHTTQHQEHMAVACCTTKLLCQAGQFIRSDVKGMASQGRGDKRIMHAGRTILPGYKVHALAYNVQPPNLSPYAVHKQDISTCPVFALCLGSSAQPHTTLRS